MRRFWLIAAAGAGLLSAQAQVDRSWSILEGGVGDKNTDTRVNAVRALGLITSDGKARQMAEKALSDPKPEVQAAGAEALGQMGAKSSAPKLIAALKTQDTAVVFAAASALYNLGDPAAYEIYYAVLTGERKSERKSGRGLIESQMKMIKDPKAMAQIGLEAGLGFIPLAGLGYPVVMAATKDDTSPVRAAAAQKLIRDSDPKTAAALMENASDENWLVRAAIVDAIAKRGAPALASALWPLLDDGNDTVRFTAAAAILRLTKQSPFPNEKGGASRAWRTGKE
jgi:HEAT repeat protein